MINYITGVCDSHISVSSVGTGENDDIAITGSDVYPRIFLEQPFVCKTDKQTITWDLVMSIMDLTHQDRSNELSKLNSTKIIMDQILQKFKDDQQFIMGDNYDYMSLTEFNDDYTSGWRVEFQFTQAIPTCKAGQNNEYFN